MRDDDRYAAVASRDRRFDGTFVTCVTSTGVFCRPSCPAQTPHRANCRFLPTPGSAAAAGFRACRRCRPDAAPGSPDWDVRADLTGRALRLIADGAVDTGGVGGLARRLAVSDRHLHRLLVAEVGVGPLTLARARRAQTARSLLDSTTMTLSDIAFAAGFASIRQFNATMAQMFGCPPGQLRRRPVPAPPADGALAVRLAHRRPYDVPTTEEFLRRRCIPGLESFAAGTYTRVLRLPGGPAEVSLTWQETGVVARFLPTDLRDLGTAVARCRALADLDSDPVAVDTALADDPALAPLVALRPGLRVPGSVDGWETAVRAVLGQQVSVAGAVTLLGRLVGLFGPTLPAPSPGLSAVFPAPEAVAAAGPQALTGLGIPRSRAHALAGLAAAVADGRLDLDPGADRVATRSALLALPGVGPWTAGYVAMRALRDPDVFPAADLALRRAAGRLGLPDDPDRLAAHAQRWSPWRSYAAAHLWAAVPEGKAPVR